MHSYPFIIDYKYPDGTDAHTTTITVCPFALPIEQVVEATVKDAARRGITVRAMAYVPGDWTPAQLDAMADKLSKGITTVPIYPVYFTTEAFEETMAEAMKKAPHR